MEEKPNSNNNNNNKIKIEDLPMAFNVKYLGSQPARGLWGIKHTRKPVDDLVEAAKSARKDDAIPLATVTVSSEGFAFKLHGRTEEEPISTRFPVDSISYGVQDVHYTRIFCMIVVRDGGDLKQDGLPFTCHAFACESRFQARQLTYALAASFEHYGEKLKNDPSGSNNTKFAIDLRCPDEITAVGDADETDA